MNDDTLQETVPADRDDPELEIVLLIHHHQ